MKIILSPSKTQSFDTHYAARMTVPVYEAKAIKLNKRLTRMSKKALSKMMHIDGELLADTWYHMHNFPVATPNHALATYTGLVYKNFDLQAYGPEEYEYLNSHLTILSAMYGILRPYDGIRPYRLDMKMKPGDKSLYDFWAKEMASYYKDEDVIIDLASTEFSKLVQGNKITLGFREFQNGQYKNLATYAKMARGKLLHQMVMNKTDTVEALKQLTFDSYTYNKDISSEQLLLFTRGDVG